MTAAGRKVRTGETAHSSHVMQRWQLCLTGRSRPSPAASSSYVCSAREPAPVAIVPSGTVPSSVSDPGVTRPAAAAATAA